VNKMSKRYAILNLIKVIPPKECPDDFTQKVIQASGIKDHYSDFQANRDRRHSFYYGAACLVTTVFLLWTINTGSSSINTDKQARLAANTQMLVQYFADGAKCLYK